MLGRIRARLTYANVVSSVCLFMMLGGVAWAAGLGPNSVGPAQIKRNAVGASEIKRNGVGGSEVRNRSLTAREFARGVQLEGPQGIQGAQGPDGERGSPGPFPTGNLPSGVTLRGAFGPRGVVTAAGQVVTDTQSFVFRLPSDPTRNMIRASQTPPAACPGTLELPDALPGHLCAYTDFESNVNDAAGGLIIDAPATSGTVRYGFRVQAGEECSAYPCTVSARGTWAVTSP